MSQLAGTALGIGTPTIYPVPQSPWGVSPYAAQGFGMQTLPQQSYGQGWSNPFIGGGYGTGTVAQQVAQLLQIVPQQIQQVQFLQQQQLAHLQQLLQLVPAQLQQLQQLVQIIPHQVQQLQQQWPSFSAGSSAPIGFGLVPQPFAGQATSHVM